MRTIEQAAFDRMKARLSPERLAWYEARWQNPNGPHFGLPVQVPAPPPLDLTPKHPRAIVTVAAGEVGKSLLEISGPLMAAYAARVGADFVVCDWPGVPSWPMSSKYAACRAFDHYERIACVDADVILRPTALNLFDACEAGEFGAACELPWLRKEPRHGVEASYLRLRTLMQMPDVPVEFYCNAGIVVASKQHRALIEPPAEAIPTSHCSEQHLLNARLAAGVDAGAVKLKILPRECNWQEWTDSYFRKAPEDAVLHFSGMRDRSIRVSMMRDWANAESGTRPPVVRYSPSRKPGTELKRLMAELGIGGLGCGCNKIAAKMDRWGPAGCRKNADELIRGPLLELSVRAFNLEPPPQWIDPERIPESLLVEVIRRSEAREPASGQSSHSQSAARRGS